jgi:hypothetical protein
MTFDIYGLTVEEAVPNANGNKRKHQNTGPQNFLKALYLNYFFKFLMWEQRRKLYIPKLYLTVTHCYMNSFTFVQLNGLI